MRRDDGGLGRRLQAALRREDPSFKYRPIRPRYRPISPFFPAADTIWGNRSPYHLQQKTADIRNIGR